MNSNQKTVKKILVVTQYFWPENFRINELLKMLREGGIECDVLTSLPNYPDGKILHEYEQNPKKYSTFNGINITRVWQMPRGNNKLTLLLNYITFSICASFYCMFYLYKRRDYDLVYGVQLSPIFSMVPAIICKKILRKPFHMWVLDIWPDSLMTVSHKYNFLNKILRMPCAWIYSSANVLFISSPGFKSYLQEMNVTRPEVIFLPQWIEDKFIDDLDKGSQLSKHVETKMSQYSDRTVFMFTGNIGEAQDFPNLLNAIALIRHRTDMVFIIIGDGRYKRNLMEKINKIELDALIVCLDSYPIDYMPYFYEYADFLFLSLRDLDIFAHTLPGKLQSYMSAGKPLVCAGRGDVKQVIEAAKCGFCVEPGNPIALAQLVEYCIQVSQDKKKKLGINAKDYANENFTLSASINILRSRWN